MEMLESIANVVYADGKKDERKSFQRYAELSKIGEKILNGLLQSENNEYGNAKIICVDGQYHFILDERENKYGFLSDVYGLTAVFSLINRFVDNNGNKVITLKDDDKAKIVNIIKYVLDYVSTQGYTIEPYYSDQKRDSRLFDKNKGYIGAMTWSLSLFVTIRKVIIKEKKEKENKEKENKEIDLGLGDDTLKQIEKEIVNIVNYFVDSAVFKNDDKNDGKTYVGWGFCAGGAPSLFFTYSVLETFSDFEDNCDEELREKIRKNWKCDDAYLEWQKICRSVAKHLWKITNKDIRNSYISDTLLEDPEKGFVSEEEIKNSTSSNALFNTLFVVFSWVYGYVNKKEKVDYRTDKYDVTDLDDAEVVSTMRVALQNVQRMFNAFRSNEYIVDTYNIVFNRYEEGKDENEKLKYIRRLNTERIFDSSLTPMLVKANNQIAFYIEKFPLKQISSLYETLYYRMDVNTWLWDRYKYDVKNTERYIEAIADFYQYYNEYERNYANGEFDFEQKLEQKTAEIREEEAARAKELIRTEVEEKVGEGIAAKEDAIRGEYTIENAIKASFSDWFKANLSSLLTDSIGHITAVNKGELDESKLTDFEKALYEKLSAMLKSYVDKAIDDWLENYRTLAVDTPALRKKSGDDLNKIADWWLKRLAAKGDAKDLLYSIFLNIKGE